MQQHNEANGGKDCAAHSDGGDPPLSHGQRPLDPRHSFVVFLENCAPVANTLNFGVSSPVLLNLPHLQLAQIKTQLALHHLNSVTANNTSPLFALLNQALLKLSTTQAMFNRGGFPGQRPMGHAPMNQPGMTHPGMNMSAMNMSGMAMAPMNQPNMNLSGMNHPGIGHQHMGLPGMTHPNIALSGMNQPNMNLNQMNHPGMNQGGGGAGMGFLPEMKTPAFGMRPMNNTGSFGGNTDPIGMKGMPMRPPMHAPSDRLMSPQVLPQRFPSPSVPVHQGQPRMPSQNQEIPSIVNRVLSHSSDHMMMKPKTPLQEPAHLMKEKRWDNLSTFGNVGQESGMKSIQSGPSLDKASNAQNRYTNESASSILESFGLSNEDLEELSRYPDDQLTPSNMPGILRDIRLRKMNRTTPVPEQPTGRRPGTEAVPSKVIDYGHSSKYQFNEAAVPARSYNPPRTEQKPPPIPKDTAAPSNVKPETTSKKGMDNKIPTISGGSRKPMWQSSKPERSNNKTLVGEDTTAPVDVSVTVSKVEQPVIGVQADATTIPDIAASVQTELKPAVQATTGVSQVAYQQPAEIPAPGQSSWAPAFSQEEARKMNKLPTPSMMNDYYAASPRIFPHICSLCNVECRHLKDWITHQNNSSHIESCRNLRQQYPQWNPQVLSSIRNEGKNDETISRKSESKSISPRRSRRSGSRHRSRKSRSRTPRSSDRRSRSRSAHRSRNSPRRSRSPRRGQRSPRRSLSPRRFKRPSNSNSPDKRAVDAAVQSFIEATERLKSAKFSNRGKKLPPKSPSTNNKNKKPASSAPPPKKPVSSALRPSASSSSSISSKKPASSNNGADKRPGSSNAPQRSTSAGSTTKKPNPGSSNYKKPVVSTGAKKTTASTSSGKKPLPGKEPAQKNPGSPTVTSTETSDLSNNSPSKSSSGKTIHVTNLPDSGYTDECLMKIIQPFGKVNHILVVRSKNEAFMKTTFREAAAAAVKFSETTPVMINNKRVTLSLVGQSKKPAKAMDKGGKVKEEPAKAAVHTGAPRKDVAAPRKDVAAPRKDVAAPKKDVAVPKKDAALLNKDVAVPKKDAAPLKKDDKDPKLEEESKHEPEVPPGFIRRYMLKDPPLNQSDQCVILVSNLPNAPYTVNEITNLAKPFGGVNDVLIVANHKKAFLELTSRNSLDSMIKFYSVFPTYLGGNLLSISVAARYKDLKDEDLIFADLIEQSAYKITPSIYEKFVYLTNLPSKDIEDFEIIRVGLRFGKVEHHVYLSNKKKAILHLHSSSAAKAMQSFLTQYPCSIKDNVIECSLPSKTELAKHEYTSYIEACETSPEIVGDKSASEEATNKESKEEASAPPTTEDAMRSDATSAQDPAKPVTSGPFSSCYAVVASEDDGDEEEAAEAPEASDTSPQYVQAATEAQPRDSHPVSQPQVSEELDVLVSVECDEEEAEDQHPFMLGIKWGALQGNECVGKKTADTSDIEGPSTDNVQDPSTESSNVEHSKDPNVMPSGKAEHSNMAAEGSNEEVSKSGLPAPENESEAPEMSRVATASSVSMIRTTKYNAQKGEISVTVTLENQKSAAKAAESRKRTSREYGRSARESSTPKSNSNRSSPANGASSHSKSGSNFTQKKSTGKYVSSQPERDSKDTSRQRERDTWSSSRKDDRIRGSSSSRYTRSSRSNNRSPRSKEEDGTFPFNLDEFVTVDEIVEEHVDPKNKAPEQEENKARKGKRKENDPLSSDTKKSRVTSTDSHELSFVTLDEVGDEEDNAGAQENMADQATQSMVTLDEVHAEDGPPASAKEEQMLMTLDEISDEDDAQESSARQRSSSVPEILPKDQLLTLDEVNEEDEEHTAPTEPSKVVATKLPQGKKDTEVKEDAGGKEPETKPKLEAQQDPPTSADPGDQSKQPLLTLDEVKADDDEMSFADIEHQFLTVDEIREDEKDPEEKECKSHDKSKAPETKDSSEAETTPTGKKGPWKRPLPQSADGNMGSSQQVPPDTSKDAAPKKTLAKAESAVETPAKKTKLESTTAEKTTKLSPFSSSTPVGLEFLVPKTGYFCELCSLFYMDDSSKLKHCKSLRHYQAVEKHLSKLEASPKGKSSSM